jgi:hypothetical protein
MIIIYKSMIFWKKHLSQISVISLSAVSAPMEKSVPGTLLEMVAGSTTCTVQYILAQLYHYVAPPVQYN